MALPRVLAPVVEDPARAAVVTDFDGTLAPIVDDPAAARPRPDALRALDELTRPLGLVAVLSGRPVAFLRRQVPLDGVTLIGQYGLERLAAGTVHVDERVGRFVDAIVAAADDAERRWPRVHVERKGTASFTVHWRQVPDAAPSPDALRDLAETYGLHVHPGRQAAEVRVPVPINKGSALCRLLDERPMRAAVFAGDDQGDLPAFAALADRSAADPGFVPIRIGIRSAEAPPLLLESADQVVDGPAGLAALLGDLVDALSRRG